MGRFAALHIDAKFTSRRKSNRKGYQLVLTIRKRIQTAQGVE
jgi:hypothetical protein